MNEELLSFLEPGGLFEASFPHFEARPQQREMLSDVLKAFDEEKIALIEAGTGTGKSLAYLLPALAYAAEKREVTVISTHTIALQQQLYTKDIPLLLNLFKWPIEVALVKGMNNYLCRRKLQDIQAEKKLLSEKEQQELDAIELHAVTAEEGSRSELPFTPLSETWEHVGADHESCTHARCPFFKECFFFQARKQAEKAHLLVVNHHLLLADLTARDATDNYETPCILPAYRRLIIDEAHHLEDVAMAYFGGRVSRRGLLKLSGRLWADRGGGKLRVLQEKIAQSYPKGSSLLTKLELDVAQERRKMVDAFEAFFLELGRLLAKDPEMEKRRIDATLLARPNWVAHVHPAIVRACDNGKRWIAAVRGLCRDVEADAALTATCGGLIADIEGLLIRLEGILETLQHMEGPEEKSEVRWIEGSAPDWHLVKATLDVAPFLKKALFERLATVVLCSATLAAGRDFETVKEALGIGEAIEKIYRSPFHFENQALFLVPRDLPDPDNPAFAQAANQAIYDCVEASRGNAFVLFTSNQTLRQAYHTLRPRLEAKGYMVLSQGEESRHRLIDRFRQGKAVLFGTDSFWEGVDVAGEALRLVILVKLPFRVPSDPLFAARSQRIAENGGSPFFDYFLPHAVIKFKQGFGRLIRHKNDRGCVVCLDGRIAAKGYGKLFLKSLPSCPQHFDTLEKIKSAMHTFYGF